MKKKVNNPIPPLSMALSVVRCTDESFIGTVRMNQATIFYKQSKSQKRAYRSTIRAAREALESFMRDHILPFEE